MFLSLFVSGMASSENFDKKIEKIINGAHRSEQNIQRNQYRHPKQTLNFFEVNEKMSVVEIWPSTGWDTEIIAT